MPESPCPAATVLRVGRISYRNVLPIYHPLEQGLLPVPPRAASAECMERCGTGRISMEFTYGPPAELNRRLRAGELDLASVSSIEYARRAEDYLLLPDLAITSRGPVQSVLLLSRVPLRDLAGERILVSAETHTSAMLLALLLKRLWRVPAVLEAGKGSAAAALDNAAGRPKAVLAIGDEALMLRSCAEYPHRFDLGQVWHEWTGLPFVFGVWAVRREFAARCPEIASEACALFSQAKAWGLAHLETLLPLAGRGFGLGIEELREYFKGLSYDLGEQEQRGLQRFFQALTEASLLDNAPGLAFASTEFHTAKALQDNHA